MSKPNSVWSTILLAGLVRKVGAPCFLAALICVAALPAAAQSWRVQCPTSTITHPDPGNTGVNSNFNNPYNGPTQFSTVPVSGTKGGYLTPTANTNGGIKCQQVSGGDGYMTEADGTQTFMFSFGPLSGLADIAAGGAGTEVPSVFNTTYPGTLVRGDPATTDGAATGASPGALGAFTYNGAIGLTPEVVQVVSMSDIVVGALPAGSSLSTCATGITASTVTVFIIEPLGLPVGTKVTINQAPNILGATMLPSQFLGQFPVSCVDGNAVAPPAVAGAGNGFTEFAFQYIDAAAAGQGAQTQLNGPTVSTPPTIDGHVDPRMIMDIGAMNGNIPGPLTAFDEDDEMFLTLTNVGMIMRPDLFEQHTIHFHGYPNASSFYDGVPDASVAINIGGSFTYYYLAPDAGTYFWHCHITPPEHLQMGMVSQLHVRPRQDRIPSGGNLYTYLGYQNGIGLPTGTAADLRTVCNPGQDILCSATMPAVNTGATQGLDKLGNTQRYTYNDGDGSTAYDVQYPLQMHGFDPNFHFVGMTFNPELFVDMKDKYFLLNGRSYPDTVGLCSATATSANNGCVPGPQASMSSDGQMHYSQPMPALINIPVGGKALLRMVNLSVSEYHTLQSLGVPMKEVGFMAKLLRDQAGMNTEFYTNSITLGGGESLDVILDASDAACGGVTGCGAATWPAGSVFYLYTPQLDHLSNDAENFGGMMTEVHICTSVTGGNTYGNVCH